MALCAGAATLLLPVFTPPELIKAIETKKPTHLFAGAAHIAACQGARLLVSQKLSSLRVVVLSGAAVPPNLVLNFAPLPQEIELLVERHPSVAQCAIAPMPDSILGEQARCYVVMKPGAQLTFDELSIFLLRFGIAKLPEKLEIMTEFPLTATRKVIKGRLRPKASDKSE